MSGEPMLRGRRVRMDDGRFLDVYHRDPGIGPHACRARLVADCAGCGRALVLCTATEAEIDAMLARRWMDAECQGGQP